MFATENQPFQRKIGYAQFLLALQGRKEVRRIGYEG